MNISFEKCNICKSTNMIQIYESENSKSLTTMNELIDGKTKVFYCNSCTHLYTKPLINLNNFYKNEYEINIASGIHDQLYDIEEDIKIYRNEHQAKVMNKLLNLKANMNILDYGCGNALTLKHLNNINPEFNLFAYEVSTRYEKIWKNFSKNLNYSSIKIPKNWSKRMDLISSFFTLEHVSNPANFITKVYPLLKEGGIFYCVVPNIYKNFADLIVADHINHFSKKSLKYLFKKNGFSKIIVNEKEHNSAFIIYGVKNTSKRKELGRKKNFYITKGTMTNYKKVKLISKFWKKQENKINQFEKNNSKCKNQVIYGAGIYGNFIFKSLKNPNNIRCFLDRNSFLNGNSFNGCEVKSLENLDSKSKYTFWLGINPQSSNSVKIELVNKFSPKNVFEYN